MKFSFALFVAALCSLAVLAQDRTVVVPKDDKPFTVDKDSLVRLTGKGIAGSKIEAEVSGPAKLASTDVVRELVNGKPLIGTTVMEFTVQPSDVGKVTVTLTVTPPQPDAKAKVSKYSFQVK